MPHYRLNMLGGFELSASDGARIEIAARKDRLLLCYLAMAVGGPQPRERLYNLLWGDRSENQARGSLRQSLAALRDAFRVSGLDPLLSTRESIELDPSALASDAVEFLEACRTPSRPDHALKLYRGELLAGADAPSPETANWLATERRRLDDLAAAAVADAAAAQTATAEAIAVARQLLARDPLREPVYRALMRLHRSRHHRSEALKVYAICRDALARDLGVKPEIETEQLYRDIITGHEAAAAMAGSTAGDTEVRPGLAVMPFDNMAGDPALQSFCEGLAEEVISGLGRFRFLDIIDRHSSAAIAKTHTDTAEIAVKLGVDMVVQGSLQRFGQTMRITARLVQAAARRQLWSETLEFPAEDLPSMPERIAKMIVASLHFRVETSLLEQSRKKPSLAAYEYLLRGIKHIRGYGPDDNRLAVECFDRALTLDSDYALAKAYRGFADIVLHDYDASPPSVMMRAKALIEEAIEIDPSEARSHWLLAMTYGCLRDFDGDIREHQKALALNPYDSNVVASYGVTLAAIGKANEGIPWLREAMRLNPYHPDWYWLDLGNALYVARRYGDAVEAFRHKPNPMRWLKARLAASYAQAGMMTEARTLAQELLHDTPDFRISQLRVGGWNDAEQAHFREGMRKAGLPA